MEKKQQQQWHYYKVLLLLLFIDGISTNPIEKPMQENLSDDLGLYNASDYVIILSVTNFKPSVYNSRKAWFIEFYNSWCGFCHRFAPVWKSLAKSIYGWRDIVTIAAIDCANDDNNPLCREYEIMRYPTLKFFPAYSKKNFVGLEVQKENDENLIMQILINQLMKEQQEQRAGLLWPNIIPYRGNGLDALWQGASENVQYEILIFEKSNSYLGAQVILDLHKQDNIRIRRITSENESFSVINRVTKFPSVIAFSRNNSQTFLNINYVSRENIRNSIVNFLKLKGIFIHVREASAKRISKHSLKVNSETESKSSKLEYKTDILYQADLESTLRYSLNNEIPLSYVIDREKLRALKAYLKILAYYLPVRSQNTKKFLQFLYKIMENKNYTTGSEFKRLVELKEKELEPVYSGSKMWIGCRGSSSYLRGYPCGLWTMFHTLTVRAADDFDNQLNNDDNPTILTILHGYIKSFFSCADCSKHFQEMSERNRIFEVNKGDDSILWLWRAHNEVNERLAGDKTEDQDYKKIQYPSTNNCPKCRFLDGKWDEVEVLKHLREKYRKPNSHIASINAHLFQKEINTSATNSVANHHKLTWDLTIFDISICVMLYIFSAMILISVCIKFAYKGNYKKKIYQNLFGFV